MSSRSKHNSSRINQMAGVLGTMLAGSSGRSVASLARLEQTPLQAGAGEHHADH